MSCTTADALDRRLIAMVKQIEKDYIHLSKQERLRVERWVEKLVSTVCPLITWKRDRNAYVSLLLRMVISKHLSTPFHSIPPDGILPRFPAYIIHPNENLHAVSDTRHERFWSAIHQHLSSQSASSSSIPIQQKKIPLHHDKSEQEQRRVIILEQLLRDERLKHCWQLNQLDAIHKNELSSLWGNWQTNNSSYSASGYSFPSSHSVHPPIDMRERAVMHGMNDGMSSYRTDGPVRRNAYDHSESNSTSFQPLSTPISAAAPSSSSSSSSSRSNRTNITTESSPLAAAKAAALLAATGIEEALAAIRALEVEESYRLSMDQPTTSSPPLYSSSKDGNTPKETKRNSHVSFSPVVLRMEGQESVDSSVDGWYPQSPQRNDNVTLFSSPIHPETRSAMTTAIASTTTPTTLPQHTLHDTVEASMSDATFLNYIERFQLDLQRLHATPINITTPL